MRPSMILVIALLSLTGCGSSAKIAKSDPAPRAAVHAPAPSSPPVAAASAQPAVQGPVAVLGIPQTSFPPAGACRVWMPGTPAGAQQAPCSCFDLMLNVPLGAWVLYTPSSDASVLQVSTYDGSKPNTLVSVDLYDAKNGKFLRTVKQQ